MIIVNYSTVHSDPKVYCFPVKYPTSITDLFPEVLHDDHI